MEFKFPLGWPALASVALMKRSAIRENKKRAFDRSHAPRGNAYPGAPAPRNPPPEPVKHWVPTPERGNHDQIVRLYKFTPDNCPLTPAYQQLSGCPNSPIFVLVGLVTTLLLHKAWQAGACKATVPKLEFGNQPRSRLLWMD